MRSHYCHKKSSHSRSIGIISANSNRLVTVEHGNQSTAPEIHLMLALAIGRRSNAAFVSRRMR